MRQQQMTPRSYGEADRAGTDLRTRRLRRVRVRRHLGAVAQHVLIAAVAVALLVPFYWMVISALKDTSQIFARPIQWWPTPARWDNFTRALTYPGYPFLRFVWNSIFYAGSVSLGTVLSSAMVGYGFACLRFPGRDLLFGLTVSTMLIPGIVLFIPTFVLFKHLGLLGSYAPLIGPAFLGNAFFIFLLRQFFRGLPRELADAARIDGAGEFRLFWQIMLPLARAPLMVTAMLSFLWTWHEFFAPLVYLADLGQYPLSLGLFAFRAQHTTEWGLLMAAATLTTLPLVGIFSFAQRYMVVGITLTGLKG
ncbi:MAG TPA: carbohydrate ABC transporter permease [Candidatus Tectomicrobia bacterium]